MNEKRFCDICGEEIMNKTDKECWFCIDFYKENIKVRKLHNMSIKKRKKHFAKLEKKIRKKDKIIMD